ncbi:MAG TPA: IclR family transcriptional regulator [Noviherbaspirillum sp.]|uniref:IclR family transcriptional regulator n=1 Tax=Noviherbaspirillum sp. TaxID=1926288 RepID=UPI002B497D9B|nr:IclR family transcriptional regulator [Noviherbaspirillum sp.]HJV84667.1 IclR family transcriptional regulator [Noviherbaspirillum sp.]
MNTENSFSDIERFDDEGPAKDRQFVTALARGLELLRCYAPKERYLGITELARRTGIPKPTVFRLAGTLAKLGYLNYSEAEGKYRLGPGVLSLGYSMLSNLDVREVAKPLMQQLAEHSQASVSIGMRDRLSMVYIESIRSSSPIILQRGVGTRLPMATTAMGRAYLAGLPDEERNFLMDQIRLSNEHDWSRIKAGIEQGLRDYADRGYCISMSDWDKGTSGVGVPFCGLDNAMMAFNCGGPSFLLTRDKLEDDIGPLLVDLVKRVSGAMGRI